MQFYRDDQGTFHRTQADAKKSGRPWKGIIVPTDSHGLCEFLNLLNPPIEFLPQIRALLSGQAVVSTADAVQPADPDPRPEEHELVGEEFTAEITYREGQPTGVFLKSRDPMAIFTCTACGKNNRNQATRRP